MQLAEQGQAEHLDPVAQRLPLGALGQPFDQLGESLFGHAVLVVVQPMATHHRKIVAAKLAAPS